MPDEWSDPRETGSHRATGRLAPDPRLSNGLSGDRVAGGLPVRPSRARVDADQLDALVPELIKGGR